MSDRRPIKERTTAWARALAKAVAATGLTPNQISVIGVFISLASLANFYYHHYLAAAVCITCRLLCNMIDGMVAVEYNKKSPSGEIFNELPDRLSDTLSLLGAAYACDMVQLGLWASLLAVLTAYIRTLCASAGAPADFGGPMAKQQRMKLLIAAGVVLTLRPHWDVHVLPATLALIVLGSAYTCWRRAHRAISHLEAQP
jgi:phosphatidylglycerophosphate synthase